MSSRLPVLLSQISGTAGIAFTPEKMAYLTNQVPDLKKETLARIKHMPFNLDKAYVHHTGTLASVVLTHLVFGLPGYTDDGLIPYCHDTGLSIIKQMAMLRTGDTVSFRSVETVRKHFDTRIDPLISTGPGLDTLVVRGEPWPRANMPLYIEDGADNFQLVYPMFDWTVEQLWAAVFLYQLPAPVGMRYVKAT